MRGTILDLLAANADHARAFEGRFDDVQAGQRPEAVTVCCSDSRVLQDHIWGNDRPGRLFTCGNIGNRVVQRTAGGTAVSGDVLYPLAHTGTEVAVVVGHTGCGAVTATYDHLTKGLDEPAGIDHCVALLADHLEPGVDALPADVDRQVGFLLDSDDVPDAVTVVGVVYDFQDVYTDRRGEVHVVNVDGERDVGTLRAENPEVADRIRRLWEY